MCENLSGGFYFQWIVGLLIIPLSSCENTWPSNQRLNIWLMPFFTQPKADYLIAFLRSRYCIWTSSHGALSRTSERADKLGHEKRNCSSFFLFSLHCFNPLFKEWTDSAKSPSDGERNLKLSLGFLWTYLKEERQFCLNSECPFFLHSRLLSPRFFMIYKSQEQATDGRRDLIERDQWTSLLILYCEYLY